MHTIPDILIEHLPAYFRRQHPQSAAEIATRLEQLADEPSRSGFFRLFALAPRWTASAPAAEGAAELSTLAGTHLNLALVPWGDDRLARLWILLALQRSWPTARFNADLQTLFSTGDTTELATLYRCLALLDAPQQYLAQMREGARTNIVPVFQAVAHHNSYARDFFDDGGWNQLVLKAIFLACPLDPIVGLEERANPELAHMLCDYVRERWAASRTVPWDIWRCIGRHAQPGDDLALLATALESNDERTRLAAGLALRDCGSAAAMAMLAADASILKTIEALDWQGLVTRSERG